MTKEEFFVKLAQTPRIWELRKNAAIECNGIRIEGKNSCPLLEVEGAKYIEHTMFWAIAAAADNCNGHDLELRRRLLQACGL